MRILLIEENVYIRLALSGFLREHSEHVIALKSYGGQAQSALAEEFFNAVVVGHVEERRMTLEDVRRNHSGPIIVFGDPGVSQDETDLYRSLRLTAATPFDPTQLRLLLLKASAPA